MLYLLDTANVMEIEKALAVFPLAGVTTNPSIISKEKRDFFDILRDIKALIGERMLHAQVVSVDAQNMVKDAFALREKVDENIYVKVPVTVEGYKAMRLLKKEGFNLTATAIYTPSQALLAGNLGVDYTAPYVNRIDNISGMGVNVVKMITELFQIHHLPTKVLAASFKNVQQVHDVSLVGCQSITVSPDVLWNLADHPLTDLSVEQFCMDWGKTYGEGKAIFNLED